MNIPKELADLRIEGEIGTAEKGPATGKYCFRIKFWVRDQPKPIKMLYSNEVYETQEEAQDFLIKEMDNISAQIHARVGQLGREPLAFNRTLVH